MATGKRQPSKQKRTQQNRQQRSALEARKAAASTPAPSGSSSAGRGGGGGGGLLGRLRGAGAPVPARRAAARGDQAVGHRAALTGLIAAGAAAAVTFIVSTPVTTDGDPYTSERVVAEWADSALLAAQETGATEPDAVLAQFPDEDAGEEWMPQRDKERLAVAAFPASAAMVLPLVGAYYAFRAVQQRRGSKIVNRAMYATLFGAVLTFGLLTFFLPTVIAVGIAGFQVRKAETQAAMAEAAAAGGDDDDVIEAEVVDDGDAEPDDDAER
jgi:hypothetical protein